MQLAMIQLPRDACILGEIRTTRHDWEKTVYFIGREESLESERELQVADWEDVDGGQTAGVA